MSNHDGFVAAGRPHVVGPVLRLLEDADSLKEWSTDDDELLGGDARTRDGQGPRLAKCQD